MVHPDQVAPLAGAVKRRLYSGALLALALAPATTGCEDTPTTPDRPGFGQVGEVTVEVRSPLGSLSGPPGVYQGALYETLRWRSNGGWTLAERVTYEGELGSETVRQSRLNPGELTREYASLIEQLTEPSSLQLLDVVLQEVNPACGAGVTLPYPSQVTIIIHDERRDEIARWIRCSRGRLLAPDPLDGIHPASSGPGTHAARVVSAARLTRTFTLGDASGSTYAGTLPFATLAQAEDSPAAPEEPRLFRSTQAGPPPAFREFWAEHAGPDTPLPSVSWPQEMVLLVAVGERDEAGAVVQISRVAQLATTLRVESVERVPGDFCSPAARRIHPFHLVVLPTNLLPVDFASPVVQRVPCGF